LAITTSPSLIAVEDNFNGSVDSELPSSIITVIFPSEESTRLPLVQPQVEEDLELLCEDMVDLLSLSLSSPCLLDENELDPEAKDACLLNCEDSCDTDDDGFLAIFCLKEGRGFRTASMADSLIQTLVALVVMLLLLFHLHINNSK
jgi:hypothetical protein